MCTSSSWWGHRRRWCPTPSRNGKGGRARPGAGTHHGVSISRLVPLLGSFGCAGLYAGARFGKARGDACAVPNRRRSGRHPACRARDALAPALVRTSTKCEIARPRSPAAWRRPSPRSPAAGRAGSHANAHFGVSQEAAPWPSPRSPVAGCAGPHAGARLGEMRGCTGVVPPQASRTAPAPRATETKAAAVQSRTGRHLLDLRPEFSCHHRGMLRPPGLDDCKEVPDENREGGAWFCSPVAGCAGSCAGTHLDEMRRRPGRRPARPSRAALAPTLAHASVRCGAAPGWRRPRPFRRRPRREPRRRRQPLCRAEPGATLSISIRNFSAIIEARWP